MPAALLVATAAALAASSPGRKAMPPLDWEPPQVPEEIRMSGAVEQTVAVRLYGNAAMKETWSVVRTDYDARAALDRYKEFFDWLRQEKSRLENNFESSSGRTAVQAARDLFEFGVEAEDRKSALENEALFSGRWEGNCRNETSIPGLGGSGTMTGRLELTSWPLNPGAEALSLTLAGELRSGALQITFRVGIGHKAGVVSGDQRMEFSALVAGEASRERGVVLRAEPFGVKGRMTADLAALFVGTMSATGTYASGAWTYRSRWPEMESLIHALEAMTGRSPTEFPPRERTREEESELLPAFELEGAFEWVPPPLPPLKEAYFMLWFDTFWEVLHEEIGRASGLEAKAALADELYKDKVIPALNDLYTYRVRQSAADHCRLWPGRPGSSLDDAFEEWFKFMDARLDERIAEAPDLEAKKEAAKKKLEFAMGTASDFDAGLLSEELRKRLGLEPAEPDSYIDRCFTGYFGFHDQIWAEKLDRAAGPEARESVAWEYFRQAASMIEYAFHGVLSEKLILDLEIMPWTEGFYADDCFRVGWSSGRTRFETALAGMKDGPQRDALHRAYRTWLLDKESLVYGSLASQALQAEVQATRETWER